MGKLEEAIASLEKQEQLLSATKREGNKTLESSIPLAATIRELLRLKVLPSSSMSIALNLHLLFRIQLPVNYMYY
jgi:hypothetical protein